MRDRGVSAGQCWLRKGGPDRELGKCGPRMRGAGAVTRVPHPWRRAPFCTTAPVPGAAGVMSLAGPSPRETPAGSGFLPSDMCVPWASCARCSPSLSIGIWACGATIVSHRLTLVLTLVTFLSSAQTSWQRNATDCYVSLPHRVSCSLQRGRTLASGGE